jgi:hypothetical protein
MPLAESLRPQVHQRALSVEERILQAQTLNEPTNITVFARSGNLPDDVTCPDCLHVMDRVDRRYECPGCHYAFIVTVDPQTGRLLPYWGWEGFTPVGKPMTIYGRPYQKHRAVAKELRRRTHVMSFFYRASREREYREIA